MKNNNNNNIIIFIESYGYAYDTATRLVHPMLKKGGISMREDESECIIEFIERVTMDGYPFNVKEAEKLQELGDLEINYALWKANGNVVKNYDGSYSTQDAQYRNRLVGEGELKEYFIREFYPQESLRYEVETSGDWLQVNDLFINCEDGRITDEGYLHYGDCYDTNITDANGIEYLEQMSSDDLDMLERFFPRTIANFKMSQIRELAESMLMQTEDYTIRAMAKAIIGFTK
jgi:hypothetical protein